MTQIKSDYSTLRHQGIIKPSKISDSEYLTYSNDIQEVITRYKHLLANQLFSSKCETKNNGKAMPTGINNGKKELLKNVNIDGINKDIITYPLPEIYDYLKQNLQKFKSNNLMQIEAVKEFKIKNLGTFYRIVKALGFIEALDWKLINLPIEKFEALKDEIESYKIEYGNIFPEHIIEISEKIGINNLEHLFTGISALGVARKYNIHKIKGTTLKTVKDIVKYVQEKFSGCIHYFDKAQIEIIQDEFADKLNGNEKEQKSKIASVLRFYGYQVEDMREYSKTY